MGWQAGIYVMNHSWKQISEQDIINSYVNSSYKYRQGSSISVVYRRSAYNKGSV